MRPADLKGEYDVVASGVPVGVALKGEYDVVASGVPVGVGPAACSDVVLEGALLLYRLGDPVRGVKARWRFGRCRNGGGRDIIVVRNVLLTGKCRWENEVG